MSRMEATEDLPPQPKLRQAICDWTRNPPPANLTPFQELTRNVDWSKSPLGPMDSWPAQLRQMVLIVMLDPNPAAVLWDVGQTIVYNEAYTTLIGEKHPNLQGQDPHIGFAEIWDHFDPLLKHQLETGETHISIRQLLILDRYGFLEETYFSWKYLPIIGPEGFATGVYASVSEHTRDVIMDRRYASLRHVSRCVSAAKDIDGLWSSLLEGLSTNFTDVPVAMLYITEGAFDRKTEKPSRCILQCTSGIPYEGHLLAPKYVEILNRKKGLAKFMAIALETCEPYLVRADDENWPPNSFRDIEWRGYGPPTELIIFPIKTTTGLLIGFLVACLNPRKPWDADYSEYIHQVTMQITTPHVSAVLLAEEVKRGQFLADHAAKQLVQRDLKHRRFADNAPIGVCVISSKGIIEFANDAYYEIMSAKREDPEPRPWLNSVHPDDREGFEMFFERLIANAAPATKETRLKSFRGAQDGSGQENKWILASGYAQQSVDGILEEVVCWITDISAQKAAASVMQQRMDEALELKRQQESFIDMISHEIRNPLSAVLSSSEEIISSLTEALGVSNGLESPRGNQISGAIEAAQTISHCVEHQRRIIDDVLVLSKLDSDLLLINPTPVKPVLVAREALKIFEGQLRASNITLTLHEDSSLRLMGVDRLLLDPNRLLQVLINLITNAIKFTRECAVRRIAVTIATSERRPSENPGQIDYVPLRTVKSNAAPDDGHVYLMMSVEDTGNGINDEEKNRLFLRFSQASVKTNVQYGGSGLGLFISRQIVEMQGGEIGLASTAGKGSHFIFFIKTKQISVAQEASADAPAAVSSDTLTNGDYGKNRMSKLKVLVVEDNAVNQKVLCKQLRNLGFDVITANHGLEALEILAKGDRFDVILCDLEMPILDGLSFIRQLRRLEEDGTYAGRVPTIAVTANARSAYIDAAMDAGMDGVTTKPYLKKDLLAEIERVLCRTES